MCCLIANVLRIFIIVVSVLALVVIAVQLLLDLSALGRINTERPVDRAGLNTICLIHCFCGTLMTVLKLKDQCYLHWWQLMTLAFIIGGFGLNYLHPESDGFSVGQKACNYFVLEYMMLTLLTVSYYTRALKSQQEV